jgi:hypothetical protein
MKATHPGSPNIDERYRTLLVLWFAICMSLGAYLAFIHFLPVKPAVNQKLTLMLNTLGLIPVATSFLIKQVLLAKAAETQRIEQVQRAYIISFALCEIPGLLALVDSRLTGSSYYYIGFAIGGLGLLLHFPRRQHLLDASPRQL